MDSGLQLRNESSNSFTESQLKKRWKYCSHLGIQCGEGNGNPLQFSRLENPRDRGAWWAAFYGVAQNWT